MKAVLIVFNQSISDEVYDILEKLNIRGFTRWLDVHGRGSEKGEPHFGTHIWPSVNGVLLTIVDEDIVEPILEEVKRINSLVEEEGLRTFVWNIEQAV
ncbi:MAG TPA: hypothetical protein ENK44_04600 [Caldithrix abyssi]|uniref:Uncharacterized protein n=1 Tax=Caldithrix abyssi TaxID=187145 RepID=A0A7V4TYX7_CALAY|nr:hypothetical protein [Caldithrix abyssi]